MELYGQGQFSVRLDWGATGALACAADLSIIVDVLSFSTSVVVAVERGMQVYPCPWRDPRAEEFARTHGAVLAVGRLEASKASGLPQLSLSPWSLLYGEPVSKLVLPSPNGSTIATILGRCGSEVAVGCLRNASVAAATASDYLEEGKSVVLVAAGERWAKDDTLRPALEDQLGAGAIVHQLRRLGHERRMSPEANAAGDLFAASESRLVPILRGCVSGRELLSKGFGEDVAVASDLDATTIFPILREGAFRQG